MSWTRSDRKEAAECLDFVRPREWECVNLVSRIVGEILHTGINRKSVLFRHRPSAWGPVDGCIYVNVYGLVLPVFREPAALENLDSRFLLSSVRSLHSVMGMSAYVGPLCEKLDLTPKTSIDYYLMARSSSEAIVGDPPNGLEIRKAKSRDAGLLMTVQRGYETEEVLLDPAHYSSATSYLILQRTLRSEIVYYAERGGKVVGKAGTNAMGMTHWQLGGIYTIPEQRNRGVARALVTELSRQAAERGVTLSLFVKKRNIAAISLYRSLGFESRGNFTISYFR